MYGIFTYLFSGFVMENVGKPYMDPMGYGRMFEFHFPKKVLHLFKFICCFFAVRNKENLNPLQVFRSNEANSCFLRAHTIH